MGKSSGVPPAVAETGKPTTVLVGLGHHQKLYREYEKWADEAGINAERIPSSSVDCPSWSKTLQKDYYSRGVSPATIHERRDLSCMPGCPYLAGIREIKENPSSYDLLIGHYNHARFEPAVLNRSIFIDEFPAGAYESEVEREWVSHYLKSHDSIPVDDYTGLVERRSEPSLRDDIRASFEENGLTPTEGELLRDSDLWDIAPVAVWGLVTARDFGNGWETASFSEFDLTGEYDDMSNWYKVVHDRENGRVFVMQEPPLYDARNIIGLDGTPTMEMWGAVIPELMETREVLSIEERKSYISDALDHEYIVTTSHTKPYSPKEGMIRDRVNVENDMALLEGIRFHEGERPGLTTTKKAKKQVYDNHGVADLVDGIETFPILGSNKFKDKRVGADIGYQHYGDGFIEKWGAYAGQAVESNHDGPRATYGEYGNEIYDHFKNLTLQATMRFGRDGEGARVYVHTDTLPEWVPVAGKADVYSLGTGAFRDVVDAIRGRDTFTVGKLPVADGTARRWVKRLYDGGYVSTAGRTPTSAVLWRNVAVDGIENGIMVVE